MQCRDLIIVTSSQALSSSSACRDLSIPSSLPKSAYIAFPEPNTMTQGHSGYQNARWMSTSRPFWRKRGARDLPIQGRQLIGRALAHTVIDTAVQAVQTSSYSYPDSIRRSCCPHMFTTACVPTPSCINS
ncbi:uncharacterized protein LAESUDRAFT_575813 [Laetiporus sulphureus 93-53]|uniref:Uncharacterized protein n=1 Tax=Laetiporus sulphureus 93-53 TaxID=1314785 RepID=A0A165B1U1_9APHY|nr:uncharacterized protein LAESUDRAFT_575813 [Laetiporus sulphureus 93-53]KZT00072.1 hypothetical protein LAESUDRAFT_575813 [Laetiporus sulphureus 93-53]